MKQELKISIVGSLVDENNEIKGLKTRNGFSYSYRVSLNGEDSF